MLISLEEEPPLPEEELPLLELEQEQELPLLEEELISPEEELISLEEEPLELEQEQEQELPILEELLPWEEEECWLPEEDKLLPELEQELPPIEDGWSPDTEDTSESSLTEEEWPTLDTELILEEFMPPEEELGSQEEELTSSISPEEELLWEDTESTWWREEDISHGSEEWETEQDISSTDIGIITTTDEESREWIVNPPIYKFSYVEWRCTLFDRFIILNGHWLCIEKFYNN